MIKLLEEQELAITGSLLISLGAAYEAIGGIRVIQEEATRPPQIVP